MAETQSKRQREEENSHEPHQSFEFESDSNSKSKRHKSYDNILSILDEESEENEPNHDLSAIFSTFENELSTTTTTTVNAPEAAVATDEQDDNQSSSAAAAAAAAGGKGEEDDSIKVIRHLLEASDDELGIPNYPNNGVDEEINSGNYNGLINASFDGFWELEDEAANYYTVLQSELFM